MEEFSQKLEKVLKKISKRLYRDLKVFDTPGGSRIRQLNEDAISSIIQKELARASDNALDITVHSLDIKEPETGFDFDIWLGESDEKYIRLTVQAKSFKNNTRTDQSYKIKKEQCEDLISYAEGNSKEFKNKHQAFPLYFFYQHLEDENLGKKHFDFMGDFSDDLHPVTIASAYSIRSLLQEASVDRGEIEDVSIRFDRIHENKNLGMWRSRMLSLLDFQNSHFAIPIVYLKELTISRARNFEDWIERERKENLSFFFFFFFSFESQYPRHIHSISREGILNLYGEKNPCKCTIIINDALKNLRDNMKEFSF